MIFFYCSTECHQSFSSVTPNPINFRWIKTSHTEKSCFVSNYKEFSKKKNSSKREQKEESETENENTNTNSSTLRSKNVLEMRKKIMREKTIKHTSEMSHKNVKYKQFRYMRYEDIVGKMKKLAKKYPQFLKIDTAQNLYKLPYPGGHCGKRKKK